MRQAARHHHTAAESRLARTPPLKHALRRHWPGVVVTLAGLVIAGRFVTVQLLGGHALWRPDSAFYLYQSLLTIGTDAVAAERDVRAYFAGIGQPFDGPLWNEPNFPLFPGRPLYSLLSAPLVAVVGYYGMFVVPVLSYLMIPVLLLRALRRVATPLSTKPGFAVIGTVLFLLSVPAHWLFAPLAEPLTIALLLGWFATLPWPHSAPGRKGGNGWSPRASLAIGFALLIAAGLSRQVIFAVVVPVALLAWCAYRNRWENRREWRDSAIVATVAMGMTSVVSLLLSGVGPLYVAFISTRVDDPAVAIGRYPPQMASQLGLELLTLLADVATVILLVIAVAGAILSRRTLARPLVLGAVVGYLLTLILVPYWTDLRLFLPSEIPLAAAASYTLARLAERWNSRSSGGSTGGLFDGSGGGDGGGGVDQAGTGEIPRAAAAAR